MQDTISRSSLTHNYYSQHQPMKGWLALTTGYREMMYLHENSHHANNSAQYSATTEMVG